MPGLPSITAADFAFFLGCPHTYTRKLDGHWPSTTTTAPLERAIMDFGLDHEAGSARTLGWPAGPEPAGNWASAHDATVALLRSGVEGVYQGTFEVPPYRGRPDLLRRVTGRSALDDIHYEPGDVKSSVRVRGEQLVQVVFYALLLEKIQDRRPDQGFIVLRDGREERFDVADYDLSVEATLAELESVRSGTTATSDRLPIARLRSDAAYRSGMSATTRPLVSSNSCLSVVPAGEPSTAPPRRCILMPEKSI